MCTMIDQYNVATCSRSPVIKVFYTLGEDNKALYSLEGHEMSVTVIAHLNGKLASGARDCTTRVWDLET
jgi:WD40 repeat protein